MWSSVHWFKKQLHNYRDGGDVVEYRQHCFLIIVISKSDFQKGSRNHLDRVGGGTMLELHHSVYYTQYNIWLIYCILFCSRGNISKWVRKQKIPCGWGDGEIETFTHCCGVVQPTPVETVMIPQTAQHGVTVHLDNSLPSLYHKVMKTGFQTNSLDNGHWTERSYLIGVDVNKPMLVRMVRKGNWGTAGGDGYEYLPGKPKISIQLHICLEGRQSVLGEVWKQVSV